MSKHAYACTSTKPPIDLDVHRRVRLRRFGLQGAVARVVSELAFGPQRDDLSLRDTSVSKGGSRG